MAQFVLRRNMRFQEAVPVRYRGHGLAGDGILQDLSLSGARIRGITPVVSGMVLELDITVPGEKIPLRVDRAAVQWVRGLDFGVELTPQRDVAQRITRLIADMVQRQHGA